MQNKLKNWLKEIRDYITHVRELITGDNTLINFIRRSKEDIIESVIKRRDYIIANSEASAKVFIKHQSFGNVCKG